MLWSLGKQGIKLTFELRRLVELVCNEMASQLSSAQHKGETRGGCGVV